MALLPWGEEDENRKGFLDPNPIKHIQSVQSTWQPTQNVPTLSQSQSSTSAQGDNYLLSQEKEQVDQQLRERREAEERARQAAEAARVAQEAAKARENARREAEFKAAPKFANSEGKDEGFWGFLKDVGAGLQQAAVSVGDTVGKGGAIVGYLNPFDGKSQEQKNADLLAYDTARRKFLDSNRDIAGNTFVGTRDIEEAATRISNGTADIRDFISVAGKGLQTGVDTAGLLNPARALTGTVGNALKFAGRDAAFFGGLQGTATFQRVYGETGDVEQAMEAALQDAAIGGALQGTLDLAGSGVNMVANRSLNSLRRPGRFGEDLAEEVGGELTPVTQAERNRLDEQGAPTDSNISFEPEQPATPTPVPGQAINELIESAEAPSNLTPVADGVPQTPEAPQQLSPVDEVELTPPQTPEVQPVDAPAVADGTPAPRPVPVVDPNTPTVKSEELQLQEARAGTSQAEEAAINQRLREIEQSKPKVDYSTPDELYSDLLKMRNSKNPEEKKLANIVRDRAMELYQSGTNPRDAERIATRELFDELRLEPSRFNSFEEFIASQGKPLYHGTNANFDRFSLRNFGQTDQGFAGRGVYLSGNKKNAKQYGKNVIKAYSKIKNPLVLEDSYFFGSIGQSRLREALGLPDNATAKQVTDKLREAGYDGVQINERTQSGRLVESQEVMIPDVDNLYTEKSLKDIFERAKAKKPRTADDELDELDARLERGEIDFDEHARLEDEIFARESAEGRMIAEDGKGNLPDDMQPSTPKKKIPKKLTPAQTMDKAFAERFVSMPAKENGMQSKLANSVGMTKDGDSAVADILRDGGVTGKKAERITKLFDEVDKIIEDKRKIQQSYRKDIKKGKDIDTDPAKTRNRLTREEADIVAKLQAEINSLSMRGKKGERLVQNLETVIQAKNINQLAGAPIERSITADVLGTALYTAKNPVAMARSITKHGNPASSAWGSTKRGWKTPPKTVAEGYKYLIGNAYRTAMTPAQIAADMRRGAFRTELTKWANKELRGKELSSAEAEKLSRIAGDDMEALVNMGAGVDNGTVNLFRYRKALKHWKDFMKTGSEASHRKFLETVDRQNQLADSIARGISSEKIGRVGAALVNGLLPYMRNAVNMTVKGVAYDLNPFTQSLIDGIRRDQRGWAANLALGIKNKTVDYAVLATLGSMLVYNPSADADDQGVPPGVSIHLGGDNYFSLRGTPLEFPLAAIQMTKEIVADTTSGKEREPGYYLNMIKNSIPYVDYMDSHGDVLKSALGGDSEDGDNGYAVKNFVVSQSKSLVPFSNNNVQASLSRLDLDGDGNRSMNAKKVYDKDIGKWFGNTLKNAYNIDRDSLPDSRDPAGRVRTVNNQGAWMNKSISDKDTAKYNSVITDLVKYARNEGIGTGTQDMFNTFDNGKNNHFNTIQSTIWAVTGKEGNDTKLKSKPMLADLSRQIRDGFFGDGDDLLTIDGKNLYSDVSMPNTRDSKNSSKPINMRAIRQAIAAADLSDDDKNRINELSGQASSLYNRAKSGEISWEQREQIMAEIAAEEQDILANSASYRRMNDFMAKLDSEGFFEKDGLGSTRSGQTFLWNALNKMLGTKGKTPAADFPKTSSGFGGGGGSGRRTRASVKPGDRGNQSIKWQPVGKRQMANVGKANYTPFKVKVKLGNAVKRDRSQNYTDRSF